MKLGEMTAEQRREQIRKVAKRMGLYRSMRQKAESSSRTLQ